MYYWVSITAQTSRCSTSCAVRLRPGSGLTCARSADGRTKKKMTAAKGGDAREQKMHEVRPAKTEWQTDQTIRSQQPLDFSLTTRFPWPARHRRRVGLDDGKGEASQHKFLSSRLHTFVLHGCGAWVRCCHGVMGLDRASASPPLHLTFPLAISYPRKTAPGQSAHFEGVMVNYSRPSENSYPGHA